MDEAKKKRKAEAVGTKPVKLSKNMIVNNNEKMELEDSEGLEKKFQSSYLGLAWISIDNISISKELNIKPNIYRVYNIMEIIAAKYDPSLTVVVVAPEDESQDIDLDNPSCPESPHTHGFQKSGWEKRCY